MKPSMLAVSFSLGRVVSLSMILVLMGAAYRHYALADYVEQLSLLEPQLLILINGNE